MLIVFLQCSEGVQKILDIEPNTFSMAWQIPQYFLLTAGEVVFSVTGLEFSYSQVDRVAPDLLPAFGSTLKAFMYETLKVLNAFLRLQAT